MAERWNSSYVSQGSAMTHASKGTARTRWTPTPSSYDFLHQLLAVPEGLHNTKREARGNTVEDEWGQSFFRRGRMMITGGLGRYRSSHRCHRENLTHHVVIENAISGVQSTVDAFNIEVSHVPRCSFQRVTATRSKFHATRKDCFNSYVWTKASAYL